MEPLQHIIDGCVRNEPRDQRQLYERYYGYCLKVVFRYIFRYETAVDVVHDGFLKVFRNFSRFQPGPAADLEPMLLGWMRTIMIHTAIDQLRKSAFIPETGVNPESVWGDVSNGSGSDDTLLYKELIAEVKKLPPAYRTVFNMYVIDGFTHAEIAAHLGISVGTSKSNLSKARVFLQKILRNNDWEPTICTA